MKKPRVILPENNQLLIDCDNNEAVQSCFRRLNRLARLGWVRPILVSCSPSKTRGHWHIIVDLHQDVAAGERVLLQLLLGSDPDRELYNYARVKNGARFPILFIEEN